MRENKIVLIFLSFILFLSVSFTYYILVINQCELDGESICYDKNIEQFGIEEDAKITLQIEDESLAQAFKDEWSKQHPEHADAVEVIITQALSLKDMAVDIPYDIVFTRQLDAAYFVEKMFPLGKEMEQIVGSRIPVQIQDAMNLKDYVFIQHSINGWFFIYNESLLSEIGFNLEDEDSSGLPDSIESWENIFANEEIFLNELMYVFPFNFEDQDAFYPFLTSGKWHLFFSNKGAEPGFSSQEFLKGLEFIDFLSQHNYTNNDEERWDYDRALYERDTAMSILHTSMDYQRFLDASEDSFRISILPSFDDQRLSPIGDVKGYFIHNKTEFPSASAEALRILRSPQVLSAFEDSTDVLVYHRNYIDELIVDEYTKQLILAYNFHDTESVLALDNNPKVLARSLWSEINFMDIILDLYHGEISQETAQQEFIRRSQEWIDGHNVE